MAVDVTTQALIERPVEIVAPFASEPSNAPAWYANIESARWVTEPPMAVGSRFEFVATFLRRRLEYTYEVVDLEPGERLVMRTADGPFRMETTYEWHSSGAGSTRMTLRNRGQPSGLSRWITPLMAPAVRRANRRDLARLKELLEAPGQRA